MSSEFDTITVVSIWETDGGEFANPPYVYSKISFHDNPYDSLDAILADLIAEDHKMARTIGRLPRKPVAIGFVEGPTSNGVLHRIEATAPRYEVKGELHEFA